MFSGRLLRTLFTSVDTGCSWISSAPIGTSSGSMASVSRMVRIEPEIPVLRRQNHGHPGMDRGDGVVGPCCDDGTASEPFLRFGVLPGRPHTGQGHGATAGHGDVMGEPASFFWFPLEEPTSGKDTALAAERVPKGRLAGDRLCASVDVQRPFHILCPVRDHPPIATCPSVGHLRALQPRIRDRWVRRCS